MRLDNARLGHALLSWLLVASFVAVLPLDFPAQAAPADQARLVRTFDLDDLGLSRPAGLAFSEVSKRFIVIEDGQGAQTSIDEITPYQEPKGSARIGAQLSDPANASFDAVRGRLLMYAGPADHIIEVSTDESGALDPKLMVRHQLGSSTVGEAKGMTVDPDTGDVFILDVSVPRIIRITPQPDGSFDDALIETVDLDGSQLTAPTSLAINPETGNLFMASAGTAVLYEVDRAGSLVNTWDISEGELSSPRGMVFAASGDLTDDPSQVSLYITDSGEGSNTAWSDNQLVATLSGSTSAALRNVAASPTSSGQIVEMSLVAVPQSVAALSSTSTLVNEIEAFNWSPPSPDTSGVVYLPASNTLMASDGEVNEMPIYDGANMFETTLSGSLQDTFTTLDFGNNEPTGVSVNPANNHLFISRDTPPKEIYEIDPGPDGQYDTSDDTITSLVTADFGASDPEGVTYSTDSGHLFIADGLNNEVHELSPGGNGVFDGVPPAGDDVVIGSFDTLVHGMEDPEGIAYNPDTGTLYIGGKTRNIGSHNFDTLLETTTTGALVQTIDVSAVNPGRQYPRQKLSGLAYGPSSVNPNNMSIYIADRGEDNNNDPNENDGRIYEVTAPGGGSAQAPPTANDDTATTAQGTSVTIDVATNDTDPNSNLVPGSASTQSGPSNGSTVDNGDGTITYTPVPTFTGSDSFVYEICDSTSLCDTATVDVTVTQEPSGQFEVRIATSSDDAEEAPGGAMSLGGSDLELVEDPATGVQEVGLRFIVNVPAGAQITDAWVQFQTNDVSSDTTNLLIEGQAADNAPTFSSTGSNISSRPRTSSSVVWTPPAWNVKPEAGPAQRTPDLSTVLQEIIGRPGWAPGNSVVLVFSGSGRRVAESFDSDPGAAALLHVDYVGTPINQAPSVVANAESVVFPDVMTLDGTVTDDGLPSSPGSVATTWSEVSGPGSVTFGDETSIDTTATFSAPGNYEIKLTADDGEFVVEDTILVAAVDPNTQQPQQITAAVFGDYGVGCCGEASVAAFVNGLSPDIVLTTGDNRYVNQMDHSVGQFYSDYIGNYGGAYGPGSAVNRYFPAVGNHDYSELGGIDVFLDFFSLPGGAVETSGTSGNERYYDVVQGPVHFFMINSDSDEPDGRTSSSTQAQWLQTQLAASTTPWQILLLHHAPYSSGDSHGPDANLQWPFESWGADAVLAGHDHVYERLAKGSIPYFVVGTGGAGLDGWAPPGDPDSQSFYSDDFGALMLEACATNITFEFHSVSDGIVDSHSIGTGTCTTGPPPIANDDMATTDEDTAVLIDVAGNDTDPGGNLDPTTVTVLVAPISGGTTNHGDGTVTYTPNQDFNGSDSFTYRICNTTGGCDTALVDITVDPTPDPPTANPDSATTSVNTPVLIDLAGNDTDPDDDLVPSSVAIVTPPSSGGTTNHNDGTVTYSPSADVTGPDSFTYEICDTTPDCDQASVDVTVSGDQVIYVTSTSGGNVGGVSFLDEDIIAFDTGSGSWSMFFDGSDVGLSASGQEIDGFHIDTDGTILITLGDAGTIPDVGAVDDHDIVRFTPTSTGDATAGSYQMFFNGEDHDLTTTGEDIDAVGMAPDGRLVVSTRGSYSVPGLSGGDVDLLAFDGVSWSLYLDGVGVGLDGGNTEDVTASWIDDNGDVYLSVRSSFDVPGLAGDSADIFVCAPASAPPISSCSFTMFWDGSDPAHGFAGEVVNGMFISGGVSTPSTPAVSVSASDSVAGEPDDDGELSFSRSGSTAGDLIVNYTVSGDATPGSDYEALSGSVTILDGQSVATVGVVVLDDPDPESSESVVVTIDPDAAYTVGSPSQATVNISDNDPPTVTVTASDSSAAEPADDGEFTISRTGPTGASLAVSYTVTGSATNGTDYTTLDGSVTIPVSSSTATIAVDVTDDPDPESSESVTVTLDPDLAYNIGVPASDTVTIADDGDLPVVSVSASDSVAGEPGDDGELSFSRSGSTAGDLIVNYTVSGDATPDSDYEALSGSVTILDGQSVETVPVVVLDDLDPEAPESVVVTIDPDLAYTVGSPSQATVNISDDDSSISTVSVSASDSVAGEPDDDGELSFSRSGSTAGDLIVNYTVSGDATPGSDYEALSGSVTILDGQSVATVPLVVLDDLDPESSESVVVTIDPDAAYTVGSPSQATVNISDDDPPLPVVTVVASDASASEPADDGEFTISRTGPTGASLVVSYTVTGSATNGTDYTTLDGSVTIPVSSSTATIAVDVTDDSDPESSESVTITLDPDLAYTVGSPSQATVNISDDDSSTPTTLEVRVGTSSDDAEERSSGSVRLNSSDLEMVVDKTNQQTIGVRFPDITIPQGASITAAWIQFTVDETSSVTTDLVIRGQASDNASTFVSTTGDVSTRPVTDSFAVWSPAAWNTVGTAGDAQKTPDLTSLVQEVVNGPQWQSGNALAVIITGTGSRVAEAYDGLPGGAPLIHIEYSTGPIPNRPPVAANDSASAVEETPAPIDVVANDTDPDQNLDPTTTNTNCALCAEPNFGTLVNDGDGTFTYTPAAGSAVNGSDSFAYEVCDFEGLCDTATVTITLLSINAPNIFEKRISASTDDAEERPSGSVSLGSSDLEMVLDKTNQQVVGLRFTGIDVPNGASITNAWIQFQTDETSTVTTDLTIRAQAADDTTTFVNTSGNISGRPVTESFELWSPSAWNVVGQAGPGQQTPNLSTIIQEIVQRPLWASGNSLVIIISGSGSRVAESFNGFAAAAPLLHIEYSSP